MNFPNEVCKTIWKKLRFARVCVMSDVEAFEYARNHVITGPDYAIISIQDHPVDVMPFQFKKGGAAVAVLNLYFCDCGYRIIDSVRAWPFQGKESDQIIDFLCSLPNIEKLIICCAGDDRRCVAIAEVIDSIVNHDCEYGVNTDKEYSRMVYDILMDDLGLFPETPFELPFESS